MYTEVAAGQWLSIRLQSMGVSMVMAIAFLGALEHHIGHVQPGLVGLSLSYALSVTGLLQGLFALTLGCSPYSRPRHSFHRN